MRDVERDTWCGDAAMAMTEAAASISHVAFGASMPGHRSDETSLFEAFDCARAAVSLTRFAVMAERDRVGLSPPARSAEDGRLP